ncbi:hypothetical protein A2U01_0099544, partial [Trifolium medium]|nr:hypothetical protein [Trifolium medium]
MAFLSLAGGRLASPVAIISCNTCTFASLRGVYRLSSGYALSPYLCAGGMAFCGALAT